MSQQTTLPTARLILRPLKLRDASSRSRLAGRREIADTTISIPRPCPKEQARRWIAETADLFARRKSAVFAMESKSKGMPAGTIGLRDIDTN